MKETCVICGKARGKRICKIEGDGAVCPTCCASIRNDRCERCAHYASSQQYHASRYSRQRSRDFVIKIDEEVEEAVDHGLKLLENDAFREGKNIIQELLREHPRNHMVQYAMGTCHALEEEYDSAQRCFDRAIDIFPYFMEARFNKAVAYMKNLDLRKTIQAFREVVEMGQPGSSHVLQAEEFLRGLEQKIRRQEGITLEVYLKGMDQFEQGMDSMNRQDWKSAISHFKQCAMINRTYPQPHGNMGVCLAMLGQKAMAIEALDKALELDPDYELAIVNRAAVASLREGERLSPGRIKSVEYYKEYPAQDKSYLRSFLQKSIKTATQMKKV